jgi:hypothetical protein
MKQPKITNASRLHILRITTQTALADGLKAGTFGAETLHAYVYPTQEIFLPVSKFSKFFVEAKPVENGLKDGAPVSVLNSGTQPIRVHSADGMHPVGVGASAGFVVTEGQRLRIGTQ